jgi:cell division protein FtsL
MTPVASTAAGRRPAMAGAAAHAPAVPRRVSGPVARPRPAQRPPVRAPRTAPPPGAAIARRVARRAAALPDARLLDRLIRGRAWIAIVGVMLIGLVFLQVSLLRLNTGIGSSVQQAASLERANQQLRDQVSALDSDERIHQVAEDLGMVMPAPGDVRYVRPERDSAARAARSVVAPAPVQQQTASATATAGSAPAATTTAPTATTAAPTATTTTAPTATTTATPATPTTVTPTTTTTAAPAAAAAPPPGAAAAGAAAAPTGG